VAEVAIPCGSFQMTVIEGLGIRKVHEKFVILVTVVLSQVSARENSSPSTTFLCLPTP